MEIQLWNETRQLPFGERILVLQILGRHVPSNCGEIPAGFIFTLTKARTATAACHATASDP
jgi:hypothetical protein